MNVKESTDRSEIVVLALNVMLGIWLIVSPFVLRPVRTSVEWNNIAVGLAVILVALEARRFGGAIRGIGVLLGAWLFASPFLLNSIHGTLVWNNLIIAFFVIIGALTSEAVTAPEPEHRSTH